MQKVDDSDSDFKEVEAVNGADGASPPEEGPATTEVSPLAQAWKLKVEQDAEQQPDAEEAPGNVEEAPEPAAAEDGEKPKYDALHGTGDPADLPTDTVRRAGGCVHQYQRIPRIRAVPRILPEYARPSLYYQCRVKTQSHHFAERAPDLVQIDG